MPHLDYFVKGYSVFTGDLPGIVHIYLPLSCGKSGQITFSVSRELECRVRGHSMQTAYVKLGV